MTDGLTESMKNNNDFTFYRCPYCYEFHKTKAEFELCISACAVIYGMKPLTEFGMVIE